jgi:hypothetical protein
MGLSNEERQALRARAAGLREEVSSLRSQQDEAVASLSQDIEDAALLREVQELEKRRDDAVESRDRATVSAADAAELMAEAAQMETVTNAVALVSDESVVALDKSEEAPPSEDQQLSTSLKTEEGK